MRDDAIPLELPEEYTPDWDKIAKAKNESIHGKASFELLKEAGIICTLVSAIIPDNEYTRNEAIVYALLVKIAKLLKAIIAMTAHLGGDRLLVLFRELIEAMAILNYLLEDSDGSRFEKYVLNSLIVEREFAKKIAENQKTNKDREKIETSMLKSIERTAKRAGIDDLSSLPSRSSINWPKFEQLIVDLNSDLYLAYRTGSTVVHSEWNDLLRNHLLVDDQGKYEINFENVDVRPQPIYASGLLAVTTIQKFIATKKPDAIDVFEERLISLQERFSRILQMHSQFLDG